MAEYYPLLAKAVANLPNSTPDTRRTIYERARKALLGQLRNLPEIAEEDITRESDALDAAVTRLETEFEAAMPPTAPAVPAVAAAEPASAAPPVIAAPAAEAVSAAPVLTPTAPRVPPLIAPRPRVPRPPPPRFVPRTQTAAPPAPADAPDGPSPAALPPAAPPPPVPQPAVAREIEADASVASAAVAIDRTPVDLPATQRPDDASQPSRLEAQRPFAPQPPRPAAPHRRTWIVAAVVGLVVATVAFAAFKLRDRPEDLARLKAAVPASDAGAGAGGKIADRVGSASSGAVVSGAATSAATSQPAQTSPGSAPAASNAPALAVAPRAALLFEAPDEPGKVKTYLGNVVWKLDNVSNGPGQPLATAVRADVDVPEDKMQVSLIFQKNLDATLPASHTVKIQFTVGAGAPTGGVRQINVPQMRQDDKPSGDSLSGIPVPITDNVFLIGLTRGTREETNIDLLRSRAWLDLPMLMSSGRIAKLTIEKGASGQRAFDDAMASWQQPGQ